MFEVDCKSLYFLHCWIIYLLYFIYFQFRGCIGFDLTKIMEAVKTALLSAKQAATRAFDRAQAKINDAKAGVTKAKDSVNRWKGGLF